MRIDIDSYREILDTLTRNKSRSFLTGFGVFWGVFMLVALMGGGNGLKELLEQNFAGFATNSALIWAQPTSKAYKGFRKGRMWTMDYKDVDRIRQSVPELDVVTPLLFSNGGTAYYGDRKSTVGVSGAMPDYQKVNEPKMFYGRFIDEADIRDHRKVCVIQKKTYKELFPGGGDPCGKRIRIDNIYYQIVGVDYNMSEGVNISGENGTGVTLPLTFMQQAYNRGNAVDLIAVTGRPGVVMSKITDRIRETVAEYYSVPIESILSQRRDKEVVMPRQIAMYFCHTMLSLPYKRIAMLFDRNDHTTAIAACNKIAQMIAEDREFADTIESIRTRIREG